MKWLLDVLAGYAEHDLAHPRGRELVAEAIIGAIPRHLVAASIAESAKAVLHCHDVPNRDDVLSRELGNNAAQTVLLLLEIDDDPENDLAIPEAITP